MVNGFVFVLPDPILRKLDVVALFADVEPTRGGIRVGLVSPVALGVGAGSAAREVLAVQPRVVLSRDRGINETPIGVRLVVFLRGGVKQNRELILDRHDARNLARGLHPGVLGRDPIESESRADLLVARGVIGDIGVRFVLDMPDAVLNEFGGLGVATVERDNLDGGFLLTPVVDDTLDEDREQVPGNDGARVLAALASAQSFGGPLVLAARAETHVIKRSFPVGLIARQGIVVATPGQRHELVDVFDAGGGHS